MARRAVWRVLTGVSLAVSLLGGATSGARAAASPGASSPAGISASSPASSAASPGIAATSTAPAAPGALVLYDPSAAALPGSAATVPVTTCGGFSSPCGGLQTTTNATASVSTPLLPTYYGHDWESGVNGVIGAGVSNHGTTEGGAVTAWLKKGDTTLALTVGVNAFQYSGKRYYPYPYP